MRVVAIAAALGAFGCNSSPSGLQAGVSRTCFVTLSGALSGTYDCRPATTTWSSFDNTGLFTFGVVLSGTVPGISVPIGWDSEPTVRTYSNTDPLAEADMSVTTSTNQVWRATVGQGTPPTGSYTLIFTSVLANASGASGVGYSAEGTLSAILTPVTSTGATGTLTLTATF